MNKAFARQRRMRQGKALMLFSKLGQTRSKMRL